MISTQRMTNTPDPKPPRYRWPWFLLAAVILAVILTALWVWGAVRKVQRIRDSTRQNASLSLRRLG